MATTQKTSNAFQPGNPSNVPNSMPGNKMEASGGGGGVNNEAGSRQRTTSIMAEDTPALFDLFYEEFLTNVMNDKELSERIPKEFAQLQSDFERVEYILHLSPTIRNFEIQSKFGIKSLDRSNKYREEGNKLFQADQAMQSLLFYNKAIAYAPHPTLEEYTAPPPPFEKQPAVQFSEDVLKKILKSDESEDEESEKINRLVHKKSLKKKGEPPKRVASPYEPLSFCYANRSAALRKLNQYDECLMDVARAAKFGYPRNMIFKLWERKGKCYLGLKRYEQASKCLRQALQCLKESNLTDKQKMIKSNEFQSLLKEWQNNKILTQMTDGAGQAAKETETKAKKDEPRMGLTGQYVLIKEPVLDPKDKKLSMVQLELAQQQAKQKAATPITPESQVNSLPPRPDRLSRQSSGRQRKISNTSGPVSPTPPNSDLGSPTTPTSLVPGGMNLQRTPSQISISNISHAGVIKLDNIEVPELSYGLNQRMPSASSGIDVCFSSEKGRYFAATHDLYPGDVILREQPYAAVLEAIFRANHCAHCMKKTPTPIPCYECSTVQYCSEACRDQSWNDYHSMECGILSYLEPSKYLGKMPHLALRIITKTGMQSLIQHSMIESQNGNGQVVDGAKDEDGVGGDTTPILFDPSSYRSVHNLATNAEKRSFEDLMKRTAEAIFMTKCLKFNGFFGDISDKKGFTIGDSRRAEIFIASLLLRHLQIASTNGLQMAECLLRNNDITKFDIIPVGGAIFPSMSFFNHSCYPNALRLGYQQYQVIRVIRSIRKGEEVNIDYGFDFYANTKEKRQQRANNQYHFVCKCVACVNNWPVYNDIMGKPRQFKCEEDKITNELADEMDRQGHRYQLAMDHLIRLDIPKALPLFRDYLLSMNQIIEHPDQRYVDCEEAYKQCLWLENRGYKPIRHGSGGSGEPSRHPSVVSFQPR